MVMQMTNETKSRKQFQHVVQALLCRKEINWKLNSYLNQHLEP